MADDLGWGDVEYNNGNARTPNLNKMAQSPNAILLQRHYSGGSVCSPTRGTVLTGRNHNRYCLWDANAGVRPTDQITLEKMPLPPSEITVAEVLKEAGYSTALYGKWHLGDFQPQGRIQEFCNGVSISKKLWEYSFDQLLTILMPLG